MHPPRSAPGSFVHTPPHRAGNPAPTPGSPKSAPPAAFLRARNACASSAGSSVRHPDTRDAPACGSHALPSGPTTHAVADTRSAASPEPTPPAAFAAVIAANALIAIARHRHRHHTARPPFTEGVLLSYLLDSRLQDRELHPFFSITHCSASLSRLRSATSFRNRVFSSRNCFASCAWLTSIPPYFAFQA